MSMIKLIEAWWHTYASVNLVIISSGNGSLHVHHQATTWPDADSLLTGSQGTNVRVMQNAMLFFPENEFLNVVCQISAILFRS